MELETEYANKQRAGDNAGGYMVIADGVKTLFSPEEAKDATTFYRKKWKEARKEVELKTLNRIQYKLERTLADAAAHNFYEQR